MSVLQSVRMRFSIVHELFTFMWQRKLWWMIPLVGVLLLAAVLLIFAKTSGLAPFIYPAF